MKRNVKQQLSIRLRCNLRAYFQFIENQYYYSEKMQIVDVHTAMLSNFKENNLRGISHIRAFQVGAESNLFSFQRIIKAETNGS